MEKKLTSIKKANPHQDLIQARKESMKKINESNEKSFEWLNENSRKFLAAGYLGEGITAEERISNICLLYTSPSPRDLTTSRMPSSA